MRTFDVGFRGWPPCRAPSDQLPSAAPGHHEGRSVPLHRGPRATAKDVGRVAFRGRYLARLALEDVRPCDPYVSRYRNQLLSRLEFVGPLGRSKADVSRAIVALKRNTETRVGSLVASFLTPRRCTRIFSLRTTETSPVLSIVDPGV